MNIVFLDVDGVITSWNFNKEYKKNYGRVPMHLFDDSSLLLLQQFILEIDASIVIFSTYVFNEGLLEILLSKLVEYDLKDRVIGYCSVGYSLENKSENLKEYLNKLNGNYKFVIFDDGIVLGYEDYHVRTNREFGITEKDITKARNILFGKARTRKDD